MTRRAIELFEEGLDCQEAVLRAFEEPLKLGLLEDFEPTPRRRAGLVASGICGSLVGATSVLLAALDEGDDRSATLTMELLRGFREEYGAITCQYLTRQMKWGDYRAVCSKYVRSAVEGLHAVMTDNLG